MKQLLERKAFQGAIVFLFGGHVSKICIMPRSAFTIEPCSLSISLSCTTVRQRLAVDYGCCPFFLVFVVLEILNSEVSVFQHPLSKRTRFLGHVVLRPENKY